MAERRLWKVYASSFLFLLLFSAGLAWGYSRYTLTRARTFLAELAKLKPGESTFADAQRLRRAYGGVPTSLLTQNPTCSEERCELLFTFDNKPLCYLPGVLQVHLGGDITVKEGRVVESVLLFGRKPNSEFDAGDRRTQEGVIIPPEWEYLYGVRDVAQRAQEEYGLRKSDPDSHGVPHFVTFRLGPRSTAEDKNRAYSIDLSCLARLRGCDSPSSIYPQGWQNW